MMNFGQINLAGRCQSGEFVAGRFGQRETVAQLWRNQ